MTSNHQNYYSSDDDSQPSGPSFRLYFALASTENMAQPDMSNSHNRMDNERKYYSQQGPSTSGAAQDISHWTIHSQADLGRAPTTSTQPNYRPVSYYPQLYYPPSSYLGIPQDDDEEEEDSSMDSLPELPPWEPFFHTFPPPQPPQIQTQNPVMYKKKNSGNQ